jgi:hypothetical protein
MNELLSDNEKLQLLDSISNEAVALKHDFWSVQEEKISTSQSYSISLRFNV